MPPSIDELKRQRTNRVRSDIKSEGRWMITGRRIAAGGGPDAITMVGAELNKVWVRSTDQSREATQAYGFAGKANMRVYCGYTQAGELVINEIDPRDGTQKLGAQFYSATLGPITGETAIIDLVLSNFRPGRVGASQDAGLFVSVQGFTTHDGQAVVKAPAFPLTAPSASGQKAWIAVCYDPLADQLIEIEGDNHPLSDVLLASEVWDDLELPSGVYPLGAAEVANGQTSAPTNFADLRIVLGKITPNDNLAATSDPTVTDDEDAGYAVGSRWVNVTGGTAWTCVDASAGAAVWIEGGSGSATLHNLSATTVPGVNDDELDGYSVGSLWMDNSGSPRPTRTYVCRDATAGAAVWEYVNRVDFPTYSSAGAISASSLVFIYRGSVPEKTTLTDVITAINQFPQILVQPDIDDFTDAQHDHESAAGGGLLDAAAIGSGLIAPARRFGEVVVTSTGNIDNLNISNATVLLMNNASDATIRGIAGGVAGQRLTIVSIGAGNVYLAHQNAGSSAGNRLINMVTSADTPLVAGKGYASYVYDATTSRWRMVDHFQGGVISFSMTWTSTGTAPTLGNGTQTSEYEIQRNMCFITFLIVMGSTTTYGTGTWLFVMPFSRVGGSTRNLVGQFGDVSAGLIRQAMNAWNSAVNITLAADSSTGIGPTVPWAWATGDTIAISGWYRIA